LEQPGSKTPFFLPTTKNYGSLGSLENKKKKNHIMKELWNPIISKNLKKLTIFKQPVLFCFFINNGHPRGTSQWPLATGTH
jgi:hypothetical protein